MAIRLTRQATHPATRCRCRGALLALALVSAPASAADFGGTLVLFATSLAGRGQDSDLWEQQYTFHLRQELTPYVRAEVGYEQFEFTSRGTTDFSRRTRQPRLRLQYDRNRVSAQLATRLQRFDTGADGEGFEIESTTASLSWRPARGPAVAVSWRDETNVADPSVFGRNSESRFLTVDTSYRRRYWGFGYAYRQSDVDNVSLGLSTSQERHDLRANASRSVLGDRLTVGFGSTLSRLDRTSVLRDEALLADPIGARQGLFAIDPTPELGELDPAPTLIDGDLATAAAGPIEIGGANTFRNLGLDLGITQPVSRLEIGVDRLSDPGLIWRVFHSRDNLVWQEVGMVTSRFDNELLRYTLRFEQVVDRFVKAVNATANREPVVLVTEVRALLEVERAAGASAVESTLYRLNLYADFRPTRRISASLSYGVYDDEDLSAGLVRRDFSSSQVAARIGFELTPELRLDLGYRQGDTEIRRQEALVRSEATVDASLRWRPLETVDAVLTAQRREESDNGGLLQSTHSLRLRVATLLLPDLNLVTDLELATLDDPFTGLERETFSWRETLEARPTPRWTVRGQYGLSRFDAARGVTSVRERSVLQLGTTWSATPFLTLTGSWGWNDDDGRTTFRQGYNLAYNPGPKLSLSASYQEFESLGLRRTGSDGLDLSYQLNRRLSLFASLTRSRLGEATGDGDEITSWRTGLRSFF